MKQITDKLQFSKKNSEAFSQNLLCGYPKKMLEDLPLHLYAFFKVAYFINCLRAEGARVCTSFPLGNSPSKITDFTRLVIQLECQPQNPWERPKHKRPHMRSFFLAKAPRFSMPGKSSISKHRNFSMEYQQGGYGTVEAIELLKTYHQLLHINIVFCT